MQKLTDKVTEIFNTNSQVAHDFSHVQRVVILAKFIAKNEGMDVAAAEAAALLHDIGRTIQSVEHNHGPAGVPLASKLLDECTNFDIETKNQILDAVKNHSELVTEGIITHIVQDADMLDGLGAVGIMRCYSASYKLPCYVNGEIFPEIGEKYKTMNHGFVFQMEWMNYIHTETAKKIAIKRHDFMQKFIDEFRHEVELKDVL